MPIYITPQKVKMRNIEDTQFHTISTIAENTITQHVQAINTAADTAIQRTEDAITDLNTTKNEIIAKTNELKNEANNTYNTVQNAVQSVISSLQDPQTQFPIDETLTMPGMAADAKVVGDLKSAVERIEGSAYRKQSVSIINAGGYYWNVEAGIGGTAVYTQIESSTYKASNPIPVSAGQIFVVSGSQSNSHKLRIWVAVDDNNTIIDMAEDSYGNMAVTETFVVPNGATKMLISTWNTTLYPQSVYQMIPVTDDLVADVTTVAVEYESGGLSGTYAPAGNTSRIRTVSTSMPRMFSGDYVTIDGKYLGKLIVSDSTRYRDSVISEVPASFTNGKIMIPDVYSGKYVGVLLKKVNAESSDISADVATVSQHVSFVSAKSFFRSGYENLLAGLKFSIMGDSMSAIKNNVPEGYDYYYNLSNRGVFSATQMWWSVLGRYTGMEPLVINAWSGSGVTQLEDSSHVNITPMSSDERCSNLGSNGVSPDVIIIAGGTNDYSYAQSAQSEPLAWDGTTTPVLGNSFTEAYACMIKKIQTNYPNAIIVACSTWFTMRGTDNGYTLTNTSNGHTYTQADYDNAIENVCKQMRIPYININNIGFNRNNYYPTYASDSETIPTHMNANGHLVAGKAIAEKIVALVRGFKSE